VSRLLDFTEYERGLLDAVPDGTPPDPRGSAVLCSRRGRLAPAARASVFRLAWLRLALLARGESVGASLAPQTAVEKPKAAAGKTRDAVVKGAKVVADKTEDALSKIGEVMTDGWVTTRVHARFVNEELLKDRNISVENQRPRRHAEGHRHWPSRTQQGDDRGEGGPKESVAL
jgi:hypothetical protein